MSSSRPPRFNNLIVLTPLSIFHRLGHQEIRPRPNPWHASVVAWSLFVGIAAKEGLKMKRLCALMLVLLLAGLAGGCGGGGEDSGGSGSSNGGNPAPPTEPPGGNPAPPTELPERNALDISVFGEGDIRVQGVGDGQLDCTTGTMCHGMFNQGEEVVLIAAPDSGWTHDNWIGCDRQDDPAHCTVFMDGDRLVSVTFLSADPLEFDDAVIVLRDDQFQGLIDYDLDTGRLVFNSATDGAGQWAIGTILLAAENPGEGLTLARRIMGIEPAGTLIVFRTEQASLEDIFRSGSFSTYGTADAGARQSSGGPITTQDEGAGTPIDINIGLVTGVRAGGWIKFPVDNHFAVNFSPSLEVRIITNVRPTARIGLEISSRVNIAAEKELLSKKLATIWIRIPTKPPVLIPMYPTLKLFVAGDVEASAAVEVGASMFVSATAGVHYKDGKLNPIFRAEVKPTYTVSSGLDYDLSWNVEVRARGELHFSLLGVAGPFAGVVPYYGITAGCGDNIAETYKGWRLEIGGDLTKIGGPRLAVPAYDSSRISQSPVSLSRMQTLEELEEDARKKDEVAKAAAEDARKATEDARKAAAAEDARKAAEDNARKKAEHARKAAEHAREDARKAAEDAHKAEDALKTAADQAREKAEAAEDAHRAVEDARKKAEDQAREKAKAAEDAHRAAEDARKKAEDARKAVEDARKDCDRN